MSFEDKQDGKISYINPNKCYLDILLFCRLSLTDYPFKIGEHINPLNLLSFMDSMFQLSNDIYQ